MNETVMELIGIVREVAPELWAMAMARVRAEIVSELFVCVVVVILSFVLGGMLRARRRRRAGGEPWLDTDADIVLGFALVCCALTLLFVGGAVIETALAPGYRALTLLAGMVK